MDDMTELVDILAGGAKSADKDAESVINLSLPTVIRGSNFTVEHSSQSEWLDVSLTSDLGPFMARATFELR